MKNLCRDILHYLLNHIIIHIPFWFVRRIVYRISGMSIGSKSIILMGTKVYNPWKIQIGNNVYINENCILDGRGGLVIKDNASISMYTKIITGSHSTSSDTFEYIAKQTIIESNVWTGVASIVLPGVILPKGVILAAGSVAIPSKPYEEKKIYSGVPAVEVGTRKCNADYELGEWKPFLR